jgi:hypothetical protein
MHHLRMAAVAAVTTCALMLAGAGVASAAQTSATHLAHKVAVTGSHGFKGTFTINRFVHKGSKIFAVGRLTGTARSRHVSKAVRMPATVGSGATTAQLPPIPGACQILNLRLGPINLNLLGLVVRTNRINVRIDAVPGAGNLLGNLLCAVTNLLNPQTTPVGTLTRGLNALLALAPTR